MELQEAKQKARETLKKLELAIKYEIKAGTVKEREGNITLAIIDVLLKQLDNITDTNELANALDGIAVMAGRAVKKGARA